MANLPKNSRIFRQTGDFAAFYSAFWQFSAGAAPEEGFRI